MKNKNYFKQGMYRAGNNTHEINPELKVAPAATIQEENMQSVFPAIEGANPVTPIIPSVLAESLTETNITITRAIPL